MEAPKIYEAISNVMADIGIVGKDSKNSQQGFMYRGIDAVMNALNPAMVKHKVFVAPTILSDEREIRTTAKGSANYVAKLTIRYDFYTVDGSSVSATVIGEASDMADKVSNKAMSIAFKYACFQVFCIPTEELRDVDPDGHSPEETVDVIDAIKVKTIKALAERKGKTLEGEVEKWTLAKWKKCYEALEALPDVKQASLDL